MKVNKLVFFTFTTFIFAFVNGCAGTYTGGGWFQSICDENAKATFGFTLHAKEDLNGDGMYMDEEVNGQFQFQDQGCLFDTAKGPAPIRFHGVIEGGYVFQNPEGSEYYEAQFWGTYTPQPENLGEGGQFYGIAFESSGNVGIEGEDYLIVLCQSGVFEGYGFGRMVQGGEFKFHPKEMEEVVE